MTCFNSAFVSLKYSVIFDINLLFIFSQRLIRLWRKPFKKAPLRAFLIVLFFTRIVNPVVNFGDARSAFYKTSPKSTTGSTLLYFISYCHIGTNCIFTFWNYRRCCTWNNPCRHGFQLVIVHNRITFARITKACDFAQRNS